MESHIFLIRDRLTDLVKLATYDMLTGKENYI